MTDNPIPKTELDKTTIYQIRLKEQLSQEWTTWLAGLTITLAENGDTLLTGPIVDQAALHGLLRKVRDCGMTLLSVNRVEPGGMDTAVAIHTMPGISFPTGE